MAKEDKLSLEKSEKEWADKLTSEEYRVLRQCGTEAPGSGEYNDFYEEGTFHCAGCGEALFSSITKFSSGSGWPSFYDVISSSKVDLLEDRSHGMHRTEARCARCGGHLGHVFPDGPGPTYKRYCINSVALKFTPKD